MSVAAECAKEGKRRSRLVFGISCADNSQSEFVNEKSSINRENAFHVKWAKS